MFIDKDIISLREKVIKHRRALHKIPELGFNVYKTKDYILKVLEECEFKNIEILAKTGIKVVVPGVEGAKTLAFRTDMDGILLNENTGHSFSSIHKGCMHGCGHDGHMAMLLGLCHWLAKNRKNIKDNIVLVFQPNEEDGGGALPMIEEGLLKNPKVDAIFGIHILPEIEQGKVGLSPGPVMAQTSEVDIILRGKSAHGALPHKGNDTIVAAAYFINLIQSLISRTVDPNEKVVFSIGRIYGGDARNVLAEKVVLECTIRTFSEKLYKEIKDRFIDILKSMEYSQGIKGEYIERVYYPPVINHEKWTKGIMDLLPKSQLQRVLPLMISEDFSYYQKNIPGVFIFLGSRNKEKGYIYPLHSSSFDFDENILLHGLQIYKEIITKY
jgi:amidohydrolase